MVTFPRWSALALGQNIKQAPTPQPLIFLDSKDTRKTFFYPNLLTPQASTTAESVQVNSSYERLPSNKRPPHYSRKYSIDDIEEVPAVFWLIPNRL